RAERVARRLLAALERPFTIADTSVDVGGSIGIVLTPEHGADSDVLLRRADVAMYVAKRAGRGFAIYSPDQDQHSPERLALLGELRRAIEKDELTLYYQPKVSLDTNQLVGVEALIRWQHPERGLVPPDQFIPLAEETGLIVPMGKWALEEACREAVILQRALPRRAQPLTMAVNLSAKQLQEPDLVRDLASILRQSGLEPPTLHVEITESVMMADTDFSVARL